MCAGGCALWRGCVCEVCVCCEGVCSRCDHIPPGTYPPGSVHHPQPHSRTNYLVMPVAQSSDGDAGFPPGTLPAKSMCEGEGV